VSRIDLIVVGFQVILPVAILLWLSVTPAKSAFSYVLQVVTSALLLAVLFLLPIWIVPPWWVPWLYAAVAAIAVIGRAFQGHAHVQSRLPGTRYAWVGAALLGCVTTGLAVFAAGAASGRRVPDATIELAFPMGPGTYLVANGGSTQTVNAHFLTLEPKTSRQRDYRGQSYAVDLIKIDKLGLRAPAWRPRDPTVYAIFGESVYAPCTGEVVRASDGMPDMPVPEMDTSRLEGNHVFLACGDFGVLLAHFRKNSLRVASGDRVRVGDLLGEAGNSGQSAEPHLHIHAQRLAESDALLSGEPLHIKLAGRFLVRNDRVLKE